MFFLSQVFLCIISYKSFSQLNETIGTKFESMDVKYGDISKTMRKMHNDLREMKNLFAKLVNHIVKE
ncbi:MAG: hypothetical protein KJ655_05525 [Candidatus Thermoplasmatota archaeon]|nr:hypothetical protein [Candidatus Thermoplasmatota archaeon]